MTDLLLLKLLRRTIPAKGLKPAHIVELINNDAAIMRLAAYKANKDNVMNLVLSVSDGQLEDLDVVKLTIKNNVNTENTGIKKSSL